MLMPTKKTFTKEAIIEASINLIKEEGKDALSIRNIAKRLNSSIQPIFYSFKNFESLINEVGNACFAIYQNYIFKNFKYDDRPYLSIGLNFIRFAHEEKNIFKFIFDNKDLDFEKLTTYQNYYSEVINVVSSTTHNEYKISSSIHDVVGVSTIGLAVLVANNKVKYDEVKTEEFLGAVFKGQVLFQEDKKDEHNRN